MNDNTATGNKWHTLYTLHDMHMSYNVIYRSTSTIYTVLASISVYDIVAHYRSTYYLYYTVSTSTIRTEVCTHCYTMCTFVLHEVVHSVFDDWIIQCLYYCCIYVNAYIRAVQ